MAVQTQLGKAFEFACLKSLHTTLLCSHQEVVIERTSAFTTAMKFYNLLNIYEREKMNQGANASTRLILNLEPQLENPLRNVPLYLTIQEDTQGILGDVRDVLCLRTQNDWEIGLSCKHNHTAVKHSRLSDTIDFGNSWFGIPCTQQYFNDINPIFTELRDLRTKNEIWSNLENKESRFYTPLLIAFINEVRHLDNIYPNTIPERLIQYLLGRNDFYKIITHDSKCVTQIQCFNLYGTLNRNVGRIRPMLNVPRLTLPTRIVEIDLKPNSGNTVIITLDNGWAVSLRIHSASTLVEPSLKFDVHLTGVPPTLISHYQSWE